MASISTSDFIVWAIDQTPYRPIELPTLVSSANAARATADTWLFVAKDSAWQKACDVAELQMFFRSKTAAAGASSSLQTITGIDPRALRRVKILANLTDDQLARFAEYMEVERVPQWSVI